MYLSSFFPTKRYARLHLPFSGSLGSHFPTFPAFLQIDLRYYVPLRLLLHLLGSLRLSLASQYPASLHSVRFPFRSHDGMKTARLRLAFFYTGRLCVRLSSHEEFAVLSSSQATLLCTCPARRLRWCPLDSPCRLQDYCLLLHQERQLSPAVAGLSSRTTKMHFSELSHAAYTLATPGFTHTFTGYACRFATDSAAHLFWWGLLG